jgi:hypothetical protein
MRLLGGIPCQLVPKIKIKKVRLLVDISPVSDILFCVMRKYSVVDEEGVVRSFTQNVGDADHSALNDAIDLAQRAGEDVVEHLADDTRVVVWSIDDATDEPWDGFRSDAEADGDALASAGFGTDEDYGGCCDW